MVRSIPAETRSIVLICGKCSKKVHGGFGADGTKRLAKMLRRLGRGGKGRKSDLLVIETKCLKLCPKNAIVAVSSRRPGQWLLVPPGSDLQMVASSLGLP